MPATLFKKETLTQVFSCEFCEIFKNIFFCVTLPVAASGKKYEINMRLFYLYGDLQTILRFNTNKDTANRQLQSHVDEHFNFRTLREEKMSNILKKCGMNKLVSGVREELILIFFVVIMNWFMK